METNYTIISLIALLALCLVCYVIFRNKKDRKRFEKDLNQSEISPEKHEDEREKT